MAARPSPIVKGPREPAEIVDLMRRLDEAELRTVVANILRNNVEARNEFQEFYDAPQGSRLRPFDFKTCLSTCLDALSEVGNDEWIRERHYSDLLYDVTHPVEQAVDQIQNVCTLDTTYTEAKLQGVDALLNIANAIENTDEYLTEDRCGEDAEGELLTKVIDAVEEIFDRSDNFSVCDSFPALLVKMETRKGLAKLSKRIKEGRSRTEDTSSSGSESA